MNPRKTMQALKRALNDAILLAHPPSAPLPLARLTRLHVVLGTSCNCRCAMCYQTDFRSALDPAIYETALRPLFPHLREIILQGGEPTILPQTRRWADLALRENPAIRFAMFTNGQRFGPEWTSFFVARGSFVHFSINAATEATYRRIVAGDADWNRLRDNVRHLDAARKAAQNLGEDDAGVAARALERAAGGHAQQLAGAVLVHCGNFLDGGFHRQGHVSARVAIRHGENVQRIDRLAVLFKQIGSRNNHFLEEQSVY